MANVAYGAEFAGKDEDASLKQHAGIELKQVPYVHRHNQLRQVPLVKPQTQKQPAVSKQFMYFVDMN